MSRQPPGREPASATGRRAHADARLRRGSAGYEVNLSSRSRRTRSPRLRVRRLLLLIACCLAVALGGEIAYAALRSYRFALKEVTISGASAAAVPAVRSRTPRMSGQTVFAVRTGRVATAVRSLPFVEQVRVRRRPPHSLLVEVKERRPAAFCRQEWGIAYLDSRGRVFTHPGGVPPGVPEVRGLRLKRSGIGRQAPGEQVAALSKTLTACARTPRMSLRVLEVAADGWMTATLASGVTVRLGNEHMLERKLRQAGAILAKFGGSSEIGYIDVSAPEAPVWNPGQSQDRADGSP